MATTLLSGAAFGAALLAAGFHQPIAVISQLKLENWHMVQAFITATASSAALYAILERLDFVHLKPRSSSPVGLLGGYDGNIIGGALLGVGMVLSGSCPGTLLVQTAVGVRTGAVALGGSILGGVIWSGLLRKQIKDRNERLGVKPHVATFDDKLRVSGPAMLAVFETICIGIVGSATLLTDKAPWAVYSGLVGGCFIGAAQVFSVFTRKTMMGISGSYEEAGNYITWALRGMDANSNPKAYKNILFGCGVVSGAWALSQAAPGLVTEPVGEGSATLALAGGVLMTIGSRMGGGCTSGHGISGLSLMSTSSLITIASMFAAGAVVAPLVH